MNSETPASTVAQLRNACQKAEEFLFQGQRAKFEQDQRDKGRAAQATQIGIQLRLVRDLPWAVPAFAEVAAIILQCPGVDSCIVQHTVALDKDIEDKQAGAITYSHTTRDTFRVFIHTGKGHAEEEGPDLLAVVREVFGHKNVNLPLPKALQ